MPAVELNWSPWVEFKSPSLSGIPRGPGLYRVRIVGQETLAYIGQTGRDLRQRLTDLRRNALATSMPFNDPHTAAPSLWAWRDATGCNFECSAAQLDFDTRLRLSIECWLLWRHRVEHGASTLCNFGRFHPNYSKSGNRRSGRIGSPLPNGEINRAGLGTTAALQIVGQPRSTNWSGLQWSTWAPLLERQPAVGPGLYRVAAEGNGLLYVGETIDVPSRLRCHSLRDWRSSAVSVSVWTSPTAIAKHELHEMENDLIAIHFEQTGASPVFQFTNGL